jgi:two-component system NtrC family sensor kinase
VDSLPVRSQHCLKSEDPGTKELKRKFMKPNSYGGLRKMILASMILVPFIPFMLVLAIGYYNFTTSLESNTIATMQRIVEDHRQMIESFLRERTADLNFILNSQPFIGLSRPENLQKTFLQLKKVSKAFVDLGIFNENGLHVAYIGPFQLTGKNYQDTSWFKEVLKKGYYISDVFLGYRQIPHFIIAVAKDDHDHKWVIRATIDSQTFNDLVEKVRIGKTGEAYLLDADGVFQSERRSGGSLMQKDPDRRLYGPAHDGIRTFIETDAKGEKFLYATTWLKDKSWLLVVRQEKDDAFKALQKASYLIVLISLLGGAGIVAVAFYSTDRIIRRMQRMDAEKDQLGEQLIRAGRLAEIGEMAAGFAHEINNPLQIIKSEYTLITMVLADLKKKGQLEKSEDVADLEDSIHQIKHQVDRCAEITQAILKFGRKGEPVSEDIDLCMFIPEVTGMVAKKAEVHGIAVKQNISAGLPPVHGDPGQLQQVLVNFLNNAVDAIVARHGSSGGELNIEAIPAGSNHVVIRIGDNGIGIPSENLPKIFTPFFTTKPVGKGTGLGLSVCYGIINKMGGELTVDSLENVGTTFSLRIPSCA